MGKTFDAINPANTVKLHFDVTETPSNAFSNCSTFEVMLSILAQNISMSSKSFTFDWEICLGSEERLDRNEEDVVHVANVGFLPTNVPVGTIVLAEDCGVYFVREEDGGFNRVYNDTTMKIGESGKKFTLTTAKKTTWTNVTVKNYTQPIEIESLETGYCINRHLSGRGVYVLKISVPEWKFIYGSDYKVEFEIPCETLDRLTKIPDSFSPVVNHANELIPAPISKNFTHRLVISAESDTSEALRSDTFWDDTAGEYTDYGYYDYQTPLIVSGVSGDTMDGYFARGSSYKVAIEFTPDGESSITTRTVFSMGNGDTTWEYKYRGDVVCTIDAVDGSNILVVNTSSGYTVNGVTIILIVTRYASTYADESDGSINITPGVDFANMTVSKSTFKATARLTTYEQPNGSVISNGHFEQTKSGWYSIDGDTFNEPLRLGVSYLVDATKISNDGTSEHETVTVTCSEETVSILSMPFYFRAGQTRLKKISVGPSDFYVSITRLTSLIERVGSTERTITMSIPNDVEFYPSTPGVSVDDGTTAKGIVGDYVQNKSTLAVNIGNGTLAKPIPKYGATITKYSTSFVDADGNELQTKTGQSLTSSTFSTPTVGVVVSVTDSRGLSNKFLERTVTLVPYNPPVIRTITANRCDADGNLDDNGIYLSYAIEFELHNFGAGKTVNYGTITVRSKRRTETSYSIQDTVQSILPATTSFAKVILPYSGNGLNVGYNYNIRIYLADLLLNAFADSDIPSADVVIDVNSNGTGIGIGKVSEHIEYDTTETVDGVETTSHYDNGILPLEIAWGTDIQDVLRLSGTSASGDDYIQFYDKNGLVHAALKASDDGENLELLVYQNGRISDDDPHTKFLPNGRIEPISTQIDALQSGKQDKMGSTSIVLKVEKESTDGNGNPVMVPAWVDMEQEVDVAGVTATSVVQVAPFPTDIQSYLNYGIVCIRQDDGKLVFQCDSVPNLYIDVNIVYWEDTHTEGNT